MILEDEPLLENFRNKKKCECCGRKCKSTDAAHIIPRGLGGGGRVDIPGNLVSLRRWCHSHQGLAGGPSLDDLKRIVEKRDGVQWSEVEEAVHAIQRLPKNPSGRSVETCIEFMEESSVKSRNIVVTALRSWREREAAKPVEVVKKVEKKKKRAKPAWYVAAQERQREYRKEARKRVKAAKRCMKSESR